MLTQRSAVVVSYCKEALCRIVKALGQRRHFCLLWKREEVDQKVVVWRRQFLTDRLLENKQNLLLLVSSLCVLVSGCIYVLFMPSFQ